jgi:hypothetical protein
MMLGQNIYGYGSSRTSWVVISIVIFDISKNDPLLVPFIYYQDMYTMDGSDH